MGVSAGPRGRSLGPRAEPVAIAAALLCAVGACARQGAAPIPVATGEESTPEPFPDDLAALPRYHSKILSAWVPMPARRGWRLHEGPGPELLATHERSHTRLRVGVMRTEALVGRTQCEERAAAFGWVPRGTMQVVEEEVAITQGAFDTEVRVAVAPPSGPGAPLVGHVLAFGGHLKKCYVFAFSTEVAGLDDAPTLSNRLAFARTRLLGELKVEGFGGLPTEGVAPEAGPAK